MSAFQVSDRHITAIADYLLHSKARGSAADFYNPETREYQKLTAKEIGQILFDANKKSLEARYGAKGIEGYSEFQYEAQLKHKKSYSPVEILKACACFDYQSCEFDGWKNSFARHLTEHCQSDAINNLPGYQAAPWGIEAPTYSLEKLS